MATKKKKKKSAATKTIAETPAAKAEEAQSSSTENDSSSFSLQRFHYVFFGIFALLAGVMAIGGSLETPEPPAAEYVREISALDLAEKLIERRHEILVLDWTDGESHIRGAIKVEGDADPVELLHEATGDDRRRTIVLVPSDDVDIPHLAGTLNADGYAIVEVRGGVQAWHDEILEPEEPSSAVVALSAYLQGRMELPQAGEVVRPPTPVVMRPRPRVTGGGGGC